MFTSIGEYSYSECTQPNWFVIEFTSLLQSAALRMSAVVTRAFAAADVAALQVECALKILVYIPALSSEVFSHLAKVEVDTGLCGFTTARNSLVRSTSSPVWKSCLLFIRTQSLLRQRVRPTQ